MRASNRIGVSGPLVNPTCRPARRGKRRRACRTAYPYARFAVRFGEQRAPTTGPGCSDHYCSFRRSCCRLPRRRRARVARDRSPTTGRARSTAAVDPVSRDEGTNAAEVRCAGLRRARSIPKQPISLEVQAGVVEELDDFKTLRFVDDPAEAIDRRRPRAARRRRRHPRQAGPIPADGDTCRGRRRTLRVRGFDVEFGVRVAALR